MKKLVAKLFIAVVILGGIPNLVMANSNPFIESASTETTAGVYGRFRLYGNKYLTHTIYLNRGYAQILLSGDGDTDLDLYLYDSTGLIGKSEGYSDKEILNVTIYNPDQFVIKVVNRGNVYNDYSLVVR